MSKNRKNNGNFGVALGEMVNDRFQRAIVQFVGGAKSAIVKRKPSGSLNLLLEGKHRSRLLFVPSELAPPIGEGTILKQKKNGNVFLRFVRAKKTQVELA